MTSAKSVNFGSLRLLKDVAIHVAYADSTLFGSPLSRRADKNVRALFAPVFDYVSARGRDDIIAHSSTLLQKSVDSEAFRNHCEFLNGENWRIRPEVLYPNHHLAQPERLTILSEISGESVEITLSGADWPRMHRFISQLCGQKGSQFEANSQEHDLVSILAARGLIEEVSGTETAANPFAASNLTFVGHNTVIVRSPSAAVVIDPFLCAHSDEFPASYQPINIRDMGRIDAIIITHSHPDHFSPASLLQFSPDTQIIVPAVARESLLAVDMADRLSELGFTNCKELDWNESIRVSDIEIHALPFYGEQPTDIAVLHPEVRNAGNTYVVRTPQFSAAFVADSGRDAAGDVKTLAAEWRRNVGPIDILFSGYRGWETYPVQLLFSSVSRYILFVPPRLWNTKLQLMNNISDAIDLAENWGARYLVPYGDGGAPWYWQMGLGPKLDNPDKEDSAFDPFPDRVVEQAKAREMLRGEHSGNASLQTLLLRPGESVRGLPERAEIVEVSGHIWPYQREVKSVLPGIASQ